MDTIYVDINPLEYYPEEKEEAIEASLGYIPQIVQQAYISPRHTKKVKYWDVLGTAYGYPLHALTAKFEGGIIYYPLSSDTEGMYPIANYILTYGEYGTLSIFQYPKGLIHVSGSENFTVRLD